VRLWLGAGSDGCRVADACDLRFRQLPRRRGEESTIASLLLCAHCDTSGRETRTQSGRETKHQQQQQQQQQQPKRQQLPQHQHSSMARFRLLLLTYDAEAAAGCCGMVCPLAGPVPHPSKEPVGHVFHYKMLLQQGVIGECLKTSSVSVESSSMPTGGLQPRATALLLPPPEVGCHTLLPRFTMYSCTSTHMNIIRNTRSQLQQQSCGSHPTACMWVGTHVPAACSLSQPTA
jgi:hypothetical protein